MTNPCSTDRIMATITDLVDMAPRASGTVGGERAAAYVAQRLRDAGLDKVWVDEVPTYAWEASSVALGFGDREWECAPIRCCHTSDATQVGEWSVDLDAEVVDIGNNDVRQHDVQGRIVLFDLAFEMTVASMLPLTEYIHDPRRELLRRDVLGSRNPYVTSLTRIMQDAAAAGAVGVIGILRDYPESVSYHNEYYRRTPLALPGVWVRRGTGEALRTALTAGAHATMRMDVRRREVPARTVHGVLHGRSRDTVMVQSHHDSIGPGAVEDASGTAEVIALAEHYGAARASGEMREKTLLFTTFDSHFTGYHAHLDFAHRYLLEPETPYRIVLNATVEHIGLRAIRGAGGSFERTGQSEVKAFFENVGPHLKWALIRAIRRHDLHGTCLVNASPLEFMRDGIPTDASFVIASGVPTFSLISGPLYLYDDADTVEMVDADQLEPVARAFIDVLDRADRAHSSLLGAIPAPLRRRLPRGRW